VRQGLAVAALIVMSTGPLTEAAYAHDGSNPSADGDKQGHAIIVVMNRVVDGLIPKFLPESGPEGRRFSVKDGFFGIGRFQPPGYPCCEQGPPLLLFPRVGAGMSLNVDPITGHSYFGPP
jgi:hypothetical protein